MPPPLRRALWAPIFWTPLRSALPHAEQALLEAAGGRHAPGRAALGALASTLGVADWLSALQADLFAAASAQDDASSAVATVSAEAPKVQSRIPKPRLREVAQADVVVAEAPAHTPVVASTVSAVDGDECSSLCASVAARFGFAVPAHADAATRDAVRELQRGWARAIERLAADLYAKDIHFLLEVVQNADDNEYDGDVMPTLEVMLETAGVSFRNNEQGFTARHARALCSVGESTKLSSDVGFIGHKGVGFKSVFKLTPTPEVHSRGFHLGFDARATSGMSDALGTGALGYIVPIPLAAPPDWDAVRGGTLIHLPFLPHGDTPTAATDAAAAAAATDFRRSLADVRPSLLLFLHRLRRLRLRDAITGAARTMTRTDEADGVVSIAVAVELSSDAGTAPLPQVTTERWLRFSSVLPAQVARAGVTRTELAIAMPLLPRAVLVAPGGLPCQEVFAFLPLRSYGFRFVLQGDWVVPSSREAVDQGSPWNQWLREEVPALFIAAVHDIVRRAQPLAAADAADAEDSPEVEAAAALMEMLFRVLPLPGQLLDFFAPVAPALLSRLVSVRCIPAASGVFTSPRLAVLLPEAGSSTVITAPDDAVAAATAARLASLGLAPVSRRVRLPPDVAAALGVRAAHGGEVLTDMLCAAAAQWRIAADVDIPWLAWALDALAVDASLSLHLPRLKAARILPLACGSLVAAADGDVYELDCSEADMATLGRLPGVRALATALRTAATARRGAARALARLGVARCEGAAFVVQHVVPALAHVDTPAAELPALFAFARRHAGTSAAAEVSLAATLRRADARLLCADGGVLACSALAGDGATPLHLGAGFSKAMGGQQAVLAHAPWRCVSEAYALDAEGAARLLCALGAVRFVAVRHVQRALPRAELPAEWCAALDECDTAGSVEVDDHESPELAAVCATAAAAGERGSCRALLACLTLHWSELAPVATATLSWRAGGEESTLNSITVPSSLALSLQHSPWLEAHDGTLRPGCSLFARSAALTPLLGEAGPWLVATPPSGLRAALGVRETLSARALLALLETWAVSGAEYACAPDRMRAIHTALAGDVPSLAQRLAAADCRWMWVPHFSSLAPNKRGGLEPRPSHVAVAGAFYSSAEVALHDASGLIDGTKATVTAAMVRIAAASRVRILDRFYRSSTGVLEALGVPAAPRASHYKAVLLECSNGRHDATAAVTAALRVICNFAYDDDAVVYSDDEEGDAADLERAPRVVKLLAELAGAAVFPTAAGGWAAPEELRFVDDTVPPGRLFTPSGGARLHVLSSATLAAAATLRAPAGAIIKDLEAILRRFYCTQLRLPLLSSAAREECDVADALDSFLSAGAPLPPLCAAAAALQRWSAEALEGPAREALRDALCSIRVTPVAELSPFLLLSGSGVTGDAPPLSPERILRPAGALSVFLAAHKAPPLLYVTVLAWSAATAATVAADWAAQLEKILPRGCGPHAAALLRALLAQRGAWRHANAAAAADAACDAAGVALLPVGEAPWLSADFAAHAEEPDESCVSPAARLHAAAAAGEDDEEEAESSGAAPHSGQQARAVLGAAMAAAADLSARRKTIGGGGRGGASGTSMAGGGSGHGFRDASSADALLPLPWSAMERDAARRAAAQVMTWESVQEPSSEAAAGALSAALSALPGGETSVAAMALGRAGEAFVAALLAAAPEFSRSRVTWVNENAETGRPYDIMVTPVDGAGDGGVLYVEVKTTSGSDAERPFVHLSLAELDWARRHGPAYLLYRICAPARGLPPTVSRMSDPAGALASGRASLLLHTGRG